mmetsp:Transcript_36878/g.82369  ORF Transcript_36878/g.82369 Transcript_36878/m.82369 type:complete len:203 (+) Transcript_36878:21-629(+)
MVGQRRSIKQLGREPAADALRRRCFERVRENRKALLEALRNQTDGAAESVISGLAREVLKDTPPDEHLDQEAMIALEQEIYEELLAEVKQQAQEEAALLAEAQNEEDCALWEQLLLPGVHCPLCGLGRLNHDSGELRCSDCKEMRVMLMDEALSMDDVYEQLGDAEARHQLSGCHKRGHFEARADSTLIHRCGDCGWCEIVF